MKSAIALAAIALLCGACRKSAPPPAPAPPPRPREAGAPAVELSMTMVSPPRPGEPPKVTLTIHNWSAHPLWLNTRFAQGTPASSDPERELTFEVTRPDGTALSPTCAPRPGSTAASADYAAVAPGAAFSKSVSVDCFDWKPGSYRIVASYLDSNPAAPVPPTGAHAFGDVLQSPPVTLVVAP